MSAVAAAAQSELAPLPVSRLIDEFREAVVEDLPEDDLTGRLERRQYVIDRLKLDFSKDAARLAAQFETDNAGDLLDAPTAGEWIRHNCKTTRSLAYDAITVGEQLSRLSKCAEALAAGTIGFAHLSVIARTSSAFTKAISESVFVEDELLERAKESSAGRLWHYCMRLRHALDPEGVATEQRIAVEERRLQFSVWDDGSVLISGQLDPIGGAALRTALEPLAQPMGQGDDRCLERRQADALSSWRHTPSMPGCCRNMRASALISRSRRRSRHFRDCRDRRPPTWSSRFPSRARPCSGWHATGASRGCCSVRARWSLMSAGRLAWSPPRPAAH